MMVRIQFDLPEGEYARAKKYIRSEKNRHDWGADAFMERVNRLEGRDSRMRMERIAADKEYLKSLLHELKEEGSLKEFLKESM
jgi:hypothetical protein